MRARSLSNAHRDHDPRRGDCKRDRFNSPKDRRADWRMTADSPIPRAASPKPTHTAHLSVLHPPLEGGVERDVARRAKSGSGRGHARPQDNPRRKALKRDRARELRSQMTEGRAKALGSATCEETCRDVRFRRQETIGPYNRGLLLLRSGNSLSNSTGASTGTMQTWLRRGAHAMAER
jgi:hypothetical protein